MQRFIDLTLNGLANGAIYAAVALSLVLIWRATRILNFAQAGMLMFTTFIAWAVIDHGASYWVGFVVALLSGLVLGALIERVIIRPVEGAPPLNAIIVTLGVLVLLQALAGMIWGGNPRSFPPAFSIKGYEVGGRAVLFSPFDLFTVVVVGALMALSSCCSAARPWACACARRRSRPRSRGCVGVRVGHMFTVGLGAGVGRGLAGRACSSHRRSSSPRTRSTRCSSSGSRPR